MKNSRKKIFLLSFLIGIGFFRLGIAEPQTTQKILNAENGNKEEVISPITEYFKYKNTPYKKKWQIFHDPLFLRFFPSYKPQWFIRWQQRKRADGSISNPKKTILLNQTEYQKEEVPRELWRNHRALCGGEYKSIATIKAQCCSCADNSSIRKKWECTTSKKETTAVCPQADLTITKFEVKEDTEYKSESKFSKYTRFKINLEIQNVGDIKTNEYYVQLFANHRETGEEKLLVERKYSSLKSREKNILSNNDFTNPQKISRYDIENQINNKELERKLNNVLPESFFFGKSQNDVTIKAKIIHQGFVEKNILNNEKIAIFKPPTRESGCDYPSKSYEFLTACNISDLEIRNLKATQDETQLKFSFLVKNIGRKNSKNFDIKITKKNDTVAYSAQRHFSGFITSKEQTFTEKDFLFAEIRNKDPNFKTSSTDIFMNSRTFNTIKNGTFVVEIKQRDEKEKNTDNNSQTVKF